MAFYFRAYLSSLPPRAADILTVRFGQLTVEGLSPSKIRSLVGCSPNVLAKVACWASFLSTNLRYSFWYQGIIREFRLSEPTDMDVLIALAVLALLLWFWVDSMHAREEALRRCAILCREMDVQLLDQTVRVARLRLARDDRGRIHVRRFYVYEFSTDGVNRWHGIAILLGQRLEHLHMEHPHGPIIQDTTS